MLRQRDIHSLDDIERAERLRKILEFLQEVNRDIPVIVEGTKDVHALRSLGLTGEIITLHNGKGIYDFCLDITDRFQKVILLLDWDKKGENLNRAISRLLKGYWEEYSFFREILKVNCQKEIKDIEGIPKLLRR